MSSAAVLARTVLLSLTDESSRRKIGWVLAAIFSPVILIVALLCCLLGGTSEHNTSMVELCFHGGALPENVPAEYRIYMEDMQSSFSKLDELIEEINSMTEGDERLDDTRVKAIFYALFFGTDAPEGQADQDFVDCFVTYEERTRTMTVTDKDGNKVEQEETYTVAVPITDLETIWSNVSAETGLTISAEQKRNADSIYNLVLYGSSTGMEGWIPGADVPYIGADGFCSPIGSGWQSRVTSEFGYRKDPFTGETRGHTGMDLSVPTGTLSGRLCPAQSLWPSTTAATATTWWWTTAADCPLCTPTTPSCWSGWDRRWRRETLYLCPVPPAAPPVPTCTLRCVSTENARTRDTICPHDWRRKRTWNIWKKQRSKRSRRSRS